MSKGIFFRGNLKESNYRLIKTTDGWVLDGEDIAYAGFDVDIPLNPHDITYINALENRIRELEAKRPQGEWIVHFDDIWPEESSIECSVCHEEQPLGIDDNYCPNCGVKMKGVDDDVS